MMARKTIDILSLGLLIQSIFLLLLAWTLDSLLIKLTGIIGSSIVILVEVVFLYEKWWGNGQ